MTPRRCEKPGCRRIEVIPTHQFVKFDGSVEYLCETCWEAFRAWWFRPKDETRRMKP